MKENAAILSYFMNDLLLYYPGVGICLNILWELLWYLIFYASILLQKLPDFLNLLKIALLEMSFQNESAIQE